MRVVQLLTQSTGGPVDHAVDVALELAARGEDSHVVGPTAASTAGARAAGVTWHELSVADKRDGRGALDVVRRLADLRPDVTHLHDRRAGLLGRAVARRRGGAGYVYTLHGVPDGLADLVAGNVRVGLRRRRDRWYYLCGERAISWWSGAQVVTPSAAVAAFARDHVRLPLDQLTVIPNGVDQRRFAPRPRPGPPQGPPTALWLGLLGGVKRIGFLLDALERVPDLRLLIAGDGPEREQVARRVGSGALAGRVELVGPVADPAPLFARADLFVLSSAAENCPLAILQAMSSGLPVVSTAVGGIPEVVRHGVDGLLCAPDDVDALAGALRLVTEDSTLRARLGASARGRVEDAYTLSRCVDRLEQVYAKSVR